VKTLTFVARPHHTLTYRDGAGVERTVNGGAAFTVADDIAEELLTQPHLTVEEAAQDHTGLSRKQLNDLAVEAGLDPADFPTKAELLDALDNTHPLDPAA
jgi:hypothetical protein